MVPLVELDVLMGFGVRLADGATGTMLVEEGSATMVDVADGAPASVSVDDGSAAAFDMADAAKGALVGEEDSSMILKGALQARTNSVAISEMSLLVFMKVPPEDCRPAHLWP